MNKKYTLSRKQRLKSRKSIEQLFREGKSFFIQPFKITYLPVMEGLQFGVAVSSRNFKKSVVRNRIKRITREAFRLQKHRLQETLLAKNKGMHVFFTYIAGDEKDFRTVFGAVEKILHKLINSLE